MVLALIAFNLMVALGCLLLAYGCWRLRRRSRQFQRQLACWQARLRHNLPTTAQTLAAGSTQLDQMRHQYAHWQRRQQQLQQWVLVLQVGRRLARRFR